MRISDWSSDVCSSDLSRHPPVPAGGSCSSEYPRHSSINPYPEGRTSDRASSRKQDWRKSPFCLSADPVGHDLPVVGIDADRAVGGGEGALVAALAGDGATGVRSEVRR